MYDLGFRVSGLGIITRVPFFLVFGFNKETLKYKGQKGTTQKPSPTLRKLRGSC